MIMNAIMRVKKPLVSYLIALKGQCEVQFPKAGTIRFTCLESDAYADGDDETMVYCSLILDDDHDLLHALCEEGSFDCINSFFELWVNDKPHDELLNYIEELSFVHEDKLIEMPIESLTLPSAEDAQIDITMKITRMSDTPINKLTELSSINKLIIGSAMSTAICLPVYVDSVMDDENGCIIEATTCGNTERMDPLVYRAVLGVIDHLPVVTEPEMMPTVFALPSDCSLDAFWNGLPWENSYTVDSTKMEYTRDGKHHIIEYC